MRAAEMRQILDRRPFEPIRIHISSGQYVDVRHPEMALVSRSLIAVGVKPANGVAEHMVWYNLLHVVKIEPLNGKRSPSRTVGKKK